MTYYVMGGQYGTKFLLCCPAHSREPYISTVRDDEMWELCKHHAAQYILAPCRTMLALVRDHSYFPNPKSVVLTPEQRSEIESVIQLKEAANGDVRV